MRKRRHQRRTVRRTAAPQATPCSFHDCGHVWRIGIRREHLIGVSSVVLRAYHRTPPRAAS
jgi:hypothetical protein